MYIIWDFWHIVRIFAWLAWTRLIVSWIVLEDRDSWGSHSFWLKKNERQSANRSDRKGHGFDRQAESLASAGQKRSSDVAGWFYATLEQLPSTTTRATSMIQASGVKSIERSSSKVHIALGWATYPTAQEVGRNICMPIWIEESGRNWERFLSL